MREWCQQITWVCSYSSSSSWCWTACSTPLVFILARWLSSSPAKCPPCPSVLALCPALLCPAPLPCPFALLLCPALSCLPLPYSACFLLPFCPALPCPALSCLPGPTSACLSLHPSVNTTDITAYSVLQCLSFQNPLPFTHTLTARLWSEGLHCFAGSVAVGTDGPVLLLHLLPVLEPLQQQQCT